MRYLRSIDPDGKIRRGIARLLERVDNKNRPKDRTKRANSGKWSVATDQIPEAC